MALKRITAPATAPVSLAEAIAHCRAPTDGTDDAMLGAFIAAAVDNIEGPLGFTGRALIDQTWELTLDEFPESEIEIPLPPLIEIVSVKYDDAGGNEQTLVEDDDYIVDNASQPGWIVPQDSWPSTFDGINAVRIRFRAGYVDNNSPQGEAVPAAIKAAIKLMVGSLYENREHVVVGQQAMLLPWSVEALLRPYRIQRGMA